VQRALIPFHRPAPRPPGAGRLRCAALAGALVLVVGCRASPAPAGPPVPIGELAWLAGTWSGTEAGTTTEEHWMAPAGGVMLGMNRTVGDGFVFGEHLRIEETNAGTYYRAWPDGQEPTSFRVVSAGPRRAVFENPAHDYPRRIVYALEGEVLSMTISGDPDQRVATWQLVRRR
jgi:hypothetical protein